MARAPTPACREAENLQQEHGGHGALPEDLRAGQMSGPASFSREIALGWSVEAMNAAADRVNKIPAAETGLAFAAFGEAVWWITVVNDALAKRYPEAYAGSTRVSDPTGRRDHRWVALRPTPDRPRGGSSRVHNACRESSRLLRRRAYHCLVLEVSRTADPLRSARCRRSQGLRECGSGSERRPHFHVRLEFPSASSQPRPITAVALILGNYRPPFTPSPTIPWA